MPCGVKNVRYFLQEDSVLIGLIILVRNSSMDHSKHCGPRGVGSKFIVMLHQSKLQYMLINRSMLFLFVFSSVSTWCIKSRYIVDT